LIFLILYKEIFDVCSIDIFLKPNIFYIIKNKYKNPFNSNDTYITLNDFSEPQNVNEDVQKLLDAIKP
jgi:hypothetical protein